MDEELEDDYYYEDYYEDYYDDGEYYNTDDNYEYNSGLESVYDFDPDIPDGDGYEA